MSNTKNLANLAAALDDASSGQVLTSTGSGGVAFADASGGGSGVTSYANKTAIDAVSSPSEGDLAYDLAADQLYIRTTSDWKRVSIGVDESPIVTTEPPTTHDLNPDGNPSTITMVATDPEGFGITYGIAYPTSGNVLPAQLATATSINQSTGVFTFDPSTTDTDAGDVKVRLSASDGVSTTTRFCTLNLSFTQDITTPNTSPFNSAGTNSYDYTTSVATSTNGAGLSDTLATGKRYLEIVRGSASNDYMFVGLCDAALTTGVGHKDTGVQSIYCYNSVVQPSTTSTGLTDARNTGDIVMIAFDTATREVWFGVNGTWYQDPSTTSSSFTVGTSSTTAFKLLFGNGQSLTNTSTGTINVGSNVTYTVPTGFLAH